MDQRSLYLPLILSFFGLVLFLLFYFFAWSAPKNFPLGGKIVIEEGTAIDSAGHLLKEQNFIRSKFLFTNLVRFLAPSGVIAGGYFFDKPETLYGVFKTMTSLEPYKRAVRITFVEGMTNEQMANLCAESLNLCNKEEFLRLTTGREGYLFPDTYFFGSNSTALVVVEALIKNHEAKLQALNEQIKSSEHTLNEILTMASILEKEASSTESRKIIAGILWKRLKIGMPLQVDATFAYVIAKNTYELTANDLKIDSPYNTYKYKGLPPTPIANPSLSSIEAALNPISTKYLFYLSDLGGRFYYAVTHDEHVINKNRYLRN